MRKCSDIEILKDSAGISDFIKHIDDSIQGFPFLVLEIHRFIDKTYNFSRFKVYILLIMQSTLFDVLYYNIIGFFLLSLVLQEIFLIFKIKTGLNFFLIPVHLF